MNFADFLRTVAVAAAICSASVLTASAGHSYRAPVCGYTQQVYNAVPYVAATYNFVGAPIRVQAQQAYTMENHPQWKEFNAFLNFRAGVEFAQQQAQQPAQPPAQQPWTPGAASEQLPAQQPPAPGDPSQMPPPNPTPPGPVNPEAPFAATIPTVVQVCGKCHSGAEPKGGIDLSGGTDLRHPENWQYRERIMRAIVNGEMPKPHPENFDPGVAGQIISELYLEPAAAQPTQ